MGPGSELSPGFIVSSISRALLERVTPELRAVIATPGGGSVTARFVYERAADGLVRELVNEAETYSSADFSPDVTVRFDVECLPVDLPLDPQLDVRRGDLWVYRRYEG